MSLLILNQMKFKSLKKIHGSGFYEALQIAKRLRKVVFLAFTSRKTILKRKFRENFFIYAYPLQLKFENFAKDFLDLIRNFLGIIIFISKLVKEHDISYIRAENVIIWGIVAYIISKLRKIPFSVYIVGDEIEAIRQKYKIRILPIVEKLLLFIYNRILASADNVATNLVDVYKNARRIAKRTYFLPTYVDPENFTCKREILTDKTVKFLYVGRLEREKGIDVLIKALNIVTEHYKDLNFKFYIIGHGLFQQKIKELAEKDARIIYIGMVDYKEMPKWYNQVDVIVIPSRTEGMPAVLLEAALCKRLVIVTPVGSMPLLVKNDKYGVITKKDDPQALVEAILRVLHLHQKQTDMLQKIVENAHRRARAILKLYLRNIGKHIPIEHLTYRYGS